MAKFKLDWDGNATEKGVAALGGQLNKLLKGMTEVDSVTKKLVDGTKTVIATYKTEENSLKKATKKSYLTQKITQEKTKNRRFIYFSI